MNHRANNRIRKSDPAQAPVVPQSFDVICSTSSDATLERLGAIQQQLLGIFIRLQSGGLTAPAARIQGNTLQEELAEVIWRLDDWQVEIVNRN